MVSTRSKQSTHSHRTSRNVSSGSIQSQVKSAAKTKSRQKKTTSKKSGDASSTQAAQEQSGVNSNNNSNDLQDLLPLELENDQTNDDGPASTTPRVFQSRFPGLQLNDFEDHLEDWTVVTLRQAIAQQGSKKSKAPSEIRSLVLSIRLEY